MVEISCDDSNSTASECLEYSFSSQTPSLSNISEDMEGNRTVGNSGEQFPLTLFLIQGFAITIVCTLGLIGNVFSVVIFSKMRRKSSFTCFLLGLTSCDTVLALTSIMTWGIPAMLEYMQSANEFVTTIYPYLVIYVYPIAITAQTGSVYFTVVVTVERYFAVCRPLECRSSRTWKRGLWVSAFVVLFAVLFNLTRWMEYEFPKNPNGRPYDQTALRQNDFYTRFYIHYGYLIVNFGLPMIILSTLNCIIYHQICRANRDRHNLSPLQTSENSMALMLIVAVIVFLLCNILPLINNMMEIKYGDVYRPYVYLGNFLVCLNSSVNVLIYYAFGERFRRYFKATSKQIFLCVFTDRVGSVFGWRSSYHMGSFKTPAGSPTGSHKTGSTATAISYCSRTSIIPDPHALPTVHSSRFNGHLRKQSFLC